MNVKVIRISPDRRTSDDEMSMKISKTHFQVTIMVNSIVFESISIHRKEDIKLLFDLTDSQFRKLKK